MRILASRGNVSPDLLETKEVQALVKEYARLFGLAIAPTLESGVIPPVMMEHLKNDVFVFSGFKTYQELREAAALLLDEKGQIKPFHRFYNDITAIKQDYNKNWLQAEYIFAQASAEMAAKWKDFEADGERYNLQYRTAHDNRVRPEHKVLHGITLPASDPFWDEFFPPNGWRCRCTVVQVRKGKYPESDSNTAIQQGRETTCQAGKNGVNKAAIFRYNPGKQQVVFPPHHPYYEVTQMEREKVMGALGGKTSNSSIRTKELKKEAKILVGKYFGNDQFDKLMTISGKGVKEWLNQPHKHYMEKNELLLDMPNLIRNSVYKGSGKDKHDPNITIHLFETEIKGDKSWIIVREHPNGVVSVHSISDSPSILNAIIK